MKLNKNIEKQLAEIEKRIAAKESKAAAATKAATKEPWRCHTETRLGWLQDTLLEFFDRLLNAMPEKWALYVVEELEEFDDPIKVIWNSHYHISLSVKYELSPLTAVAINLAAIHTNFADPETPSIGKLLPLMLPESLCKFLADCTATANNGGLLLTTSDGQQYSYECMYWECEDCAYYVPGPVDKANADTSLFRACPVCGGFCGDWFMRRDRERDRANLKTSENLRLRTP